MQYLRQRGAGDAYPPAATKMGVRIAIDDFGTGYASYARLKSVDADILKIDGSFIRNIVSNSPDYQIVASICHLARMKKMLVVAEYVETEEIRSAVHALGIDYVQGYLIGRPEALESLWRQRRPDGRLSRYAATSALSSSILSSQPVTASQYCCSFPDPAEPAHSG